jgi:hypothetical protein
LQNWSPSRWQVILAFAIVPGVAASAMAVIEPLYAGIDSHAERIWRTAITFSLLGAYPSALIFGVPTYFYLRRKIAATWVNFSLAGAFVAAMPWLLIILLGPQADQASIGNKATVIDGSRTFYGWVSDLQFVGQIAVFGALAGLLFWTITTSRKKTR